MDEKTINIENLRKNYENNAVFMTAHAIKRISERKISAKDVRLAVENGQIIEQYPDDYPYPSCLILGESEDKTPIHVVISDEGTSSRIITAYFPDNEIWEEDFITRKEK